MDKHINFLIDAAKHSQMVDHAQTIKSIKQLFQLDKTKGDLKHFENFLNELDSIIDEKLVEMKKAL